MPSLGGHREWESKVELSRNGSTSLTETWSQIRTSEQKQKEGSHYQQPRKSLCGDPSLLGIKGGTCSGCCQEFQNVLSSGFWPCCFF